MFYKSSLACLKLGQPDPAPNGFYVKVAERSVPILESRGCPPQCLDWLVATYRAMPALGHWRPPERNLSKPGGHLHTAISSEWLPEVLQLGQFQSERKKMEMGTERSGTFKEKLIGAGSGCPDFNVRVGQSNLV